MAKIEMDVTEYDSLRKNITLLEEAKKEQASLYAQIDKLNVEKLDAYKKAEKQIIIRKVIETREFITPTYDSVENLSNLLREVMQRTPQNYTSSHRDYILSILSEVISQKSTMQSHENETYTTQGLDQYIKEAKEAAYEKLSEKAKEALKNVPKLQQEIVKLKKLEVLNTKLNAETVKLADKMETMQIAMSREDDISDVIHNQLEETLSLVATMGYFNFGSKVQKIISLDTTAKQECLEIKLRYGKS